MWRHTFSLGRIRLQVEDKVIRVLGQVPHIKADISSWLPEQALAPVYIQHQGAEE